MGALFERKSLTAGKRNCGWWLQSNSTGYAVTKEGFIENESNNVDWEEANLMVV
jgi:hypothetical protein